ncbi:MAG: T9SS type A sorting domain-containing protein [Saprospiraceae bacterium]|nr:T9SS type A sorting domain-containing protein [Saprospiraceae bacterium]
MRIVFALLLLVLFLHGQAVSQAFYNVTFNSGAFPSGWSANDARAFVIDNVSARSCCYTSSPTSPQASSFHNVLFQNCTPNGQTVSVTVAGVISTVGRSNIRVGFGRRATGAWDRPMSLEWSSDGSNWNLIDDNIPATPLTEWNSNYYDLPASADNVSNLRFRFSFITESTFGCAAAPNFRIDDFTVGSNFSLPAELSEFSASLQPGRQVLVEWSTITETDNASFAVEHSTDGRNFSELTQIPGAGTTREPRNYSFLHRQPAAGINYYRLRQNNIRGDAAYSRAVGVKLDQTATFRIFPSPTSELLTLEWPTDAQIPAGATWAIYDMVGRRLSFGVFKPEQQRVEISVSHLFSGLYLIQIQRFGFAAEMQQFTKD